MAFVKILALALVAAVNLGEVYGHGRLMDPVNRSSAWRKGFKTEANYNDNELFCGGQAVQHQKNGGKCGICGDEWSLPQPRPNENGGRYGKGVIVKQYNAGAVFTAEVELTANHYGSFLFDLCKLNDSKELETEECFQPLELADGSGNRYPVAKGVRHFKVDLKLPEGVKCEHCVIRWNYRTGNTWGMCPDGKGAVGCGPQENFKGCADVSIL